MSVDTPAHQSPIIDQQPLKSNVPTLDIKPTKGWGNLDLHEVWQYRELLFFFIWRDIKGGYQQQALGPFWMIINPLVSMVVYSFVLGTVAKLPSEGIPYPIFTYTALLPWNYFSGAAGGAVSSLVGQMGVISKVYFPRLIVPLTSVVSGLVNFAISCLILLGMMAYFDYSLSWTALTLPLYLLLAMATALGVGLWSATLAVRYRDVRNVVKYMMRFWMYATPVAYSASLIPDRWQLLYQLNPMYWVIEGFRWALLGKGQPPQPLILLPVGFVLLLLISGAFVFRRTERTIVDLL